MNNATPTGTLYDSIRLGVGGASLVENLNSQLKQKEGEIVQLQMDLRNLERVRDNMSQELTKLTRQVEAFDTMNEQFEDVKKMYTSTEEKYQTLLTVKY